MPIASTPSSSRSSDRAGVALPTTLFALIAVSVVMTSLILTGSTEAMISQAHQDATTSLYTVEQGIESYVALSGVDLAAANPFVFTPPGGGAADAVRLSVQRLAELPGPDPAFPDRIFSIRAEPERGGRELVAMARLGSQQTTVNMGMDAGVTVGSDVKIRGNTTVSDGSDSPFCTEAPAEHAIETTTNAEVDTGGNVTLVGTVGEIESSATNLVETIFGVSLPELIANADISFAAGTFGGSSITSIGSVANPSDPSLTPYNWGCPADMYIHETGPNQGQTKCEADADTAWFPIVAIDAKNPDGSWGVVTVNLSHGQGMLIVYNGSLRIQGNLIYKGVILVEGGFHVHASGGGATAPKIEGALIGLGMGPGVDSVIEEEIYDQNIQGSPTIRFNRCALNIVKDAIEDRGFLTRTVDAPTFGWFEVVR